MAKKFVTVDVETDTTVKCADCGADGSEVYVDMWCDDCRDKREDNGTLFDDIDMNIDDSEIESLMEEWADELADNSDDIESEFEDIEDYDEEEFEDEDSESDDSESEPEFDPLAGLAESLRAIALAMANNDTHRIEIIGTLEFRITNN